MPIVINILKNHNWQSPIRLAISNRLAFSKLDPHDYLELLFQTSAHIVQWREKDLISEENQIFIRHGVKLARRYHKLFFVNTLFEMAFEEVVDGVHLTSEQDIGMVRDARERLQSKTLIGKSIHTVAEAQIAEKEGAEYLLLGPIFDPLSKVSYVSSLGLRTLREVVKMVKVPVFAVGGIDESRFEKILETGVHGVAGITWAQREVAKMCAGA
ncbi:MAG: thiamine phosphate synthase [Acidobacteriota bacterium]|nr:thiamine phosphate synthase [Acidobacteriota bacterium]